MSTIDENKRYHGQALSGGPIVVKLMPRNEWEGDTSMLFGPICLCSTASDWLRRTFPKGGTFQAAWRRCPRGEWIGYVGRMLADEAYGALSAEYRSMSERTWCRTAAQIRAAVPYGEIESLIRKVMAGRPEVIG